MPTFRFEKFAVARSKKGIAQTKNEAIFQPLAAKANSDMRLKKQEQTVDRIAQTGAKMQKQSHFLPSAPGRRDHD
jgi:hypothetical protein